MSRAEMVATLEKEIGLGLKHPDTAIRELNPDWSEQRIQEEIDKLTGAEEETPSEPPPNSQGSGSDEAGDGRDEEMDGDGQPGS